MKMLLNSISSKRALKPQGTSHENRFIDPPGGGGNPLLKPYRYLAPQRVWFLRRFGLKTVTEFAHFGLESGIVFEGATVVYEHICRLVPNG